MQESSLQILLRRFRFDGLFWRRFAQLGCVYGPDWWKHYSPSAIAFIIFALVGRNRRGAIANLRHVLPRGQRQHAALAAYQSFAEFAHCYTESAEYYGARPNPVRIDPPERDLIAEELQRGHGVVLLTGHFGNWDLAAKTLREYGRPINIVMAHDANATTHADARAVHEEAGVKVIYSDSSVFSSLNMIRALRNNEIVALQLDRMNGAGGGRLIPFFGSLAWFPSGPFVLARLGGSGIIPAFFPRLGRRHYAIRFGGRFFLPRDARDPRAVERVMAEVVATFESTIREYPTQWFQFAPFWPEDSPAAETKSIDPTDARATGESCR